MLYAEISYTGDGLDDHQVDAGIRGLYALVKRLDAAAYPVARTVTMPAGQSMDAVDGSARGPFTDAIKKIGRYVILGTNAAVNASGGRYLLMVWGDDGEGDLDFLSWTGDGNDDRSVGGARFGPEYSTVFGARVYTRTSDMPAGESKRHGAAVLEADRIQAHEANGLQLGTSDVNTLSTVYHAVLMRNVRGALRLQAWTGNGTTGRLIGAGGPWDGLHGLSDRAEEPHLKGRSTHDVGEYVRLGNAAEEVTDKSVPEDLFAGASFKAHYEFEADGSDEFGGNALTEHNTPTYVAAVHGNGARLIKASNQYFSLASGAAGDFDPGSSDCVVAMFVKLDTYAQTRFAYKGRVGGSLAGWMFQKLGAGGLRFSVNDGVISTVSTDGAWPEDSAFHSFVGVIDQTANKIRLYVDGAFQSEADISSLGSIGNAGNDLIVSGQPAGEEIDGYCDIFVFLTGRTWSAADVARYHAGAAFYEAVGSRDYTVGPGWNRSGIAYYSASFTSTPPRVSAALRAAIAESGAVWLLELDLPGGTRRYSTVGVASLSQGQYAGKVLTWPRIRRGLSDESSGSISNTSVSVTLDDTDREWAKLEEGPLADQIEGSAARIRLAARGVEPEDWSTRFVGTVSTWRRDGTAVTPTLRPQDGPFLRQVPMAGWVITPAVWPLAAAGVHGEIAPIVLGTHDSAAFTNGGFLPGILIDTTGNKRHLFAARRLNMLRVYKDRVQQASGWTASIELEAGREWTVVDWDTDPGDDVLITADAEGDEDVGDGTGAVIENPVLQLKHLLINWFFRDSPSGAWATTSPYVDDASFARLAAHFDSYVSARRISESTEGKRLLEEWAESHHFRTYWTPDGKLAVGVEDPTVEQIYIDAPWLRHHTFDQVTFALERRDRNRVTRLTAHYVYDESEGKFLFVADIAEPTKDEVREELDLRWGPAS